MGGAEDLWDYHTTVRTHIDHPPFTLASGIDTVAPLELAWSLAQIANYSIDDNDAMLAMEYEEREEKQEHVQIVKLKYKRRMMQYHNARGSTKKLV